MPQSLQDILRRKSVAITFDRTMGLLGATTLGVGALMGAGIYVLIGLAAGRAGPSVWLSYAICGILVLPSVLMFAELSRLMPVAGGGYAYSYHSLGSLAGFVVGWLLAWGGVFACAMYSLGFAYYLGSLAGYEVSNVVTRFLALALVVFLTHLNCRGARGGERYQRLFTWGNLAVLTLLIGAGSLQADPANLLPAFPQGAQGMAGAIAIIYVSFFGYQLIANNAEEVIEPRKTIPRAMLASIAVSVAFYVGVALISVMLVPWQNLAEAQAPLVDVATRSLGTSGWLIVAAGGILASAAALNSTLLSQGRQIFAMGRHGLLPSLLGRIHEMSKTPNAALLAGGAVVAIAVIVGDLEFIAKSANFCFITSMIPVSLALNRVLKEATAPPSLPRRLLPAVALLSNLGLLLTLDWISFVFGVQLLVVGLAVYFLYSRPRESRARVGMSIVLSEQPQPLLRRRSRILAPMANPRTQRAILAISQSLLHRDGGEIVVLSVITAPEQIDFYSVLSNSESSVEILEAGARVERPPNIEIQPVVRVSRNLARGIIDAAEEHGCSLIVMGYEGPRQSRTGSLTEELLRFTRTDIVLLKIRGEFRPRRIAASLFGTENLDLIVNLTGALADRYQAEITFLSILPPQYSVERKAVADKVITEAIRRHRGRALYRTEILSAEHPLELLVERSSEFDLLIVGSSRVGLFEQIVVGAFATQVVERSKCSVAVVRAIPPSRKTISRVVGK